MSFENKNINWADFEETDFGSLDSFINGNTPVTPTSVSEKPKKYLNDKSHLYKEKPKDKCKKHLNLNMLVDNRIVTIRMLTQTQEDQDAKTVILKSLNEGKPPMITGCCETLKESNPKKVQKIYPKGKFSNNKCDAEESKPQYFTKAKDTNDQFMPFCGICKKKFAHPHGACPEYDPNHKKNQSYKK